MYEMIAAIIMGSVLLFMGLFFKIDTIKGYYDFKKEE